MSWYTDPQLFIYSFTHVYRITKQFGINPVTPNDFTLHGTFNFSQHLSMASNKETDFNAFKATFPTTGIFKFANSQGWVINWDLAKQTGTWSREEPNSPFWYLPGITKPKSVTEETLEKKVSDLEEKNSYLEGESKRTKEEKEAIEAENATLKAQVNRQRGDEAIDKRVLDLEAEIATLKAEKTALINGLKREEILAGLEALEKKVVNLTLKPVHCCCGGAGGGSVVEGPWITGHTVPSNWVPFGDLDVQPFSKNIPLMITRATGGLKFRDDNTTNVQANRFYGGIFPIVVVDVTELTPDREEARFDPGVWSRYNNAGNSYAARKPFPSEMSIDAHRAGPENLMPRT